MKKIKSKIKKFFISLISLTGILVLANIVFAETTQPPNLTLQQKIFTYTKATDIAEYIATVYEFSLYTLAPLAIVVVIYGGARWATAGGNVATIKEAKKYISGAVVGLIIGILSYVILSMLELTVLVPPGGITYIDPIPLRGSVVEEGGKVDPEKKTTKQEYHNMACPNIADGELKFDIFFTSYYKPLYGEKGPYSSFLCNLGMQCSCPNGRSKTKDCSAGGLTWGSCLPFEKGEFEFCDATKSKAAPTLNTTVAADEDCFSVGTGCQIKVAGKILTVQDIGGDIKGRHMDFFAGEGWSIYKQNQLQGVQSIEVLTPAKCIPAGGGGGGGDVPPSEGTYSHDEAVNRLQSNGIGVTSSGKVVADCKASVCPSAKWGSQSPKCACTSLDNIGKAAIDNLIRIEKDNNCNITVTGGTEPGHSTHCPGRAVVDLRTNDCLVPIFKNKDLRKKYSIYKVGGDKKYVEQGVADFLDAGHFHVEFEPRSNWQKSQCSN